MKFFVVIFILFVCLYTVNCRSELLEEERAKKKKVAKFWSTILLLLFSKLAITKVVSALLFWFIFQKLAYIITWVVNFYLKSKKPERFVNTDHYNNHHDYNTVGYSYGPPKEEHVEWSHHAEPLKEYGVPQNWPYSRSSNDVV